MGEMSVAWVMTDAVAPQANRTTNKGDDVDRLRPLWQLGSPVDIPRAEAHLVCEALEDLVRESGHYFDYYARDDRRMASYDVATACVATYDWPLRWRERPFGLSLLIYLKIKRDAAIMFSFLTTGQDTAPQEKPVLTEGEWSSATARWQEVLEKASAALKGCAPKRFVLRFVESPAGAKQTQARGDLSVHYARETPAMPLTPYVLPASSFAEILSIAVDDGTAVTRPLP